MVRGLRCFLPRRTLASPYSSELLHPPPLPQVIREFGYLVRCITPREGVNLGIFFKEVLVMVDHWRVSGWPVAEGGGSCRQGSSRVRG